MQEEEKLRKGPWLEEEDELLTAIVTLMGERRWDLLAKASGLRRSGKSCRLRWLNYLRPNLKHGRLSEEEERIILQLHKQWGNKWSKIARRLPGRTDNEIKNYWRSHLRKKAQLQEKGYCKSSANDSKQDLLVAERDEIRLTSGNGEFMSAEPFDKYELMSYGFTGSPYESRLTDYWLSGWSDEQSEVKHHGECPNNLDLCFCYNPVWDSEDSVTTFWDSSCSLWNTH